ncbi:hypothetical protein EVAR_33918_1 [Eumeta japonica]|uniref:Uncharacterized protein n=1 Tax=Eumeta variegata TaxID=151549 RepID=A0A4C1VXQ6_EUMVA|nr:hypothetical protein EVAR_33918_1 [Eumeta japonica]
MGRGARPAAGAGDTGRPPHLLIARSLPRGRGGRKNASSRACQRGKKSVSDRPLAAESIILIEGGGRHWSAPPPPPPRLPGPLIYYRRRPRCCSSVAASRRQTAISIPSNRI